MKMNIFRIVISKTKDINENRRPKGLYIETNAKSKDEIELAYKAGVKIVGVDIQKILEIEDYSGYGELLEAYEKIKPMVIDGDLDISIIPEAMKYFGRKDFAKDSDIDDPEEYENDLVIDIPEYYLLWRATARLGNPDLIINDTDKSLDIDIGGNYEWFSSW